MLVSGGLVGMREACSCVFAAANDADIWRISLGGGSLPTCGARSRTPSAIAATMPTTWPAVDMSLTISFASSTVLATGGDTQTDAAQVHICMARAVTVESHMAVVRWARWRTMASAVER